MPGFSPQAITALVEAAAGGTFSSSSPSPAKYRSGSEVAMLVGNCGIDRSRLRSPPPPPDGLNHGLRVDVIEISRRGGDVRVAELA